MFKCSKCGQKFSDPAWILLATQWYPSNASFTQVVYYLTATDGTRIYTAPACPFCHSFEFKEEKEK